VPLIAASEMRTMSRTALLEDLLGAAAAGPIRHAGGHLRTGILQHEHGIRGDLEIGSSIRALMSL